MELKGYFLPVFRVFLPAFFPYGGRCLHKSSTHLSAQLSVQPHFYPNFRPQKSNEMCPFGRPFFGLQPCPFNASFITPVNTRLPPVAMSPMGAQPCPAATRQEPQMHPPSRPFVVVRYMVAAQPSGQAATGRYKPAVARFTPRPAHCPHHTKRAARRAVFSGHALRLDAVQLVAVRCAQLHAAQPPFCPAD